MNNEPTPDNTNYDWDLEARLTAYALGELDETEATELTRRIAGDEDAARQIETIRATGDLLSGALAGEPELELSELQRQRIKQGPSESADAGDTRVFSFRSWRIAGLAVAACLAIVVTGVIVVPRLRSTSSLDQYAIAPRSEPNAAAGGTAGKDRDDSRKTTASAAMSPGTAAAGEITLEELAGSQRTHFSAPAEVTIDTTSLNLAAAPATVDEAASVGRPMGGRGGGGSPSRARSAPMSKGVPASPPPAPSMGVPLQTAREFRQEMAEDAVQDAEGFGVRRSLEPVNAAAPLSEAEVDAMSRKEKVETLGLIAKARRDARRAGENERDVRLRQDWDLLRDSLTVDGQMFQRENYAPVVDNPFVRPTEQPKSTFSVDVDTASYSNVRSKIERGIVPPPGAVRIEEMINYFDYDYAAPDGDDPFSVNVEIGPAPWAEMHRLVRVGLKGKTIDVDERPATNLVFLVDVSGSMQPANKLPLVQRSLDMLLDRLTPDDRIAIATYAGNPGLVLPSTYKYEEETIRNAIADLRSGGSTNGGAGIDLAYKVATDHFIEGGVNRVILCTDGDFNVGVTSDDALKRLIEEKRETGVFLSVLGFGSGNFQDRKMEELSNAGNGHYGYIDDLAEARKVFVDELAGTLVTIAKDVKIQIDFNPAHVGAYRLIGYENRMLATQDFRDDRKDAGEIGAGHTVTALYEVIPPSEMEPLPEAEESKFQKVVPADDVADDEMLELRLRYKQPDGEAATEMAFPITDEGRGLDATSADFRFAAGVAAYGMILRQSPHKGDATFAGVLDLVAPAVDAEADEDDLRRRFLDLVEKTRALTSWE